MIQPFLISERSIPSRFMHQSSLTMLAHSEVMTVSKCTTRHKLSAVAMKPVIMQEKFSVSQGKGMPQRSYIHTPVQTPGTDRCMHNYPSPTTHYRNMTTGGIHWTSTNGMVPLKTFSLSPPGVQPQTKSKLTVVSRSPKAVAYPFREVICHIYYTRVSEIIRLEKFEK